MNNGYDRRFYSDTIIHILDNYIELLNLTFRDIVIDLSGWNTNEEYNTMILQRLIAGWQKVIDFSVLCICLQINIMNLLF